MDIKSEPAFTETPVTDWEFATIGGTRTFTLEDGVDSCELTTEAGVPCFVIKEVRLNERNVVYVGPGLIGYLQRSRIKKVPVKPVGPQVKA